MSVFRTIGEGHYHVAFPDHGIEFDVDRLRRDRHELHGELAVSCGIIGARAIDGVLSIGSFNISSPRMRQERAKLLAERARTNGKIDWLGMLEEVCQRAPSGRACKASDAIRTPRCATSWTADDEVSKSWDLRFPTAITRPSLFGDWAGRLKLLREPA